MIPIYDSYNTPDQQIDTGSGGQIILPKGDKGDPGKSAYQLAVDNGFEGTEQQWLDSLKLTLPNGTTDGQLLTWNLVSGKAEWKILEKIDGGNPAVPITQSQMRRGDATAWSVANPVLKRGEWGLDTTVQRVKLGDGVTPWNALPFLQRPPQIDYFNTIGNFTWTKPAGARSHEIIAFGGGGAGTTGGRVATTASTQTNTGGNGGSMARVTLDASVVPTIVQIVVGTGGIGVSGRTTDDTVGTSGSYGMPSTFGDLVIAMGGPASNVAATAPSMFGKNGQGGATNGGGGAGGNAEYAAFNPAGGGTGAGVKANDVTEYAGGSGGAQLALTASFPSGTISGSTYVNPLGGTSASPNGQNGLSAPIDKYWIGGSGGGGGACKQTANGGNGGNGGWPGGGGGGGGSSRNGYVSGKAGNGGDGRVTVITYF